MYIVVGLNRTPTTLAWWVTNSFRNTEYLCSIPGKGRNIVAQITTSAESSLCPIPSGRLNTPGTLIIGHPPRLFLSVEECPLLENLGCTCAVRMGQIVL